MRVGVCVVQGLCGRMVWLCGSFDQVTDAHRLQDECVADEWERESCSKRWWKEKSGKGR